MCSTAVSDCLSMCLLLRTAHAVRVVFTSRSHVVAFLGEDAYLMDNANPFPNRAGRNKAISFRVDEDEYNVFANAAKEANMNLTDWFRKHVLDVAERRRERVAIRLMQEDVVFIKDALTSSFEHYFAGNKLTLEEICKIYTALAKGKVSRVDAAMNAGMEAGKKL